MKIRIKGNSVRFRLAQDEVTALVQNGEVWSQCQFGTSALSYGLLANNNSDISSEMQENTITCHIPKLLLENWDTDERVGFENRTDSLFLLIEKDWQCLKPRAHEDESNLYQNPQA